MKKEWKVFSKKIQSPLYQGEQFHLQRYQYYIEQQDYLSSKSRKAYTYLDRAVFDLQAHFVAASLKLACLNVLPQTEDKYQRDPELTELLLQRVEAGLYKNSPVVMVYFYAYRMLQTEESSFYFDLVKWLNKNWYILPPAEMQDIYQMGLNFCVSVINKGDHSFIQHAFELYQSGLDNKVLLDEGVLSIHNYKNILRLGIALKAYDWVEEFMDKFKTWLPKDERENTYLYNLAYYYYRKPDYDKTMELLRQVKFTDVFNNLDARRMLLRIYFDLQEWDALDSHLDSFKSFVMRQKNLGYHRKSYLDLIKIVRLIIKKGLLDKKAKENIRNRILNSEQIVERDWLLALTK